MQPSLRPGERFVLLKLDKEPGIGEIVVFDAPRTAGPSAGRLCGDLEVPVGAMCPASTVKRGDVSLVMRVVALGGDRISMRGGRIVLDGEPETGYEVRGCSAEACEFPREITVPDGQVFLLGDNRGESFDSRFYGPLPEDWILGRYWFSYAEG